ncbi:sugar ABC transporter substrate-binding protein [Clostridia bacterium]|nr:sugar ABC transporter substrate-binding protein [Clostridia bacterium]
MKTKRILAIACSVMLALFMLAACAGGSGNSPSPSSNVSSGSGGTSPSAQLPTAEYGESVALKLWAPQEMQDELKSMMTIWSDAHPDTKWDFTYGVVSEGDLKTKYGEDPNAAADVFMFASDQLRDLVDQGGLYEVTRNKADIIARNSEVSVEAASLNGKLYGYPMSADNGYFLYYDKSVLSDDDVKSFEKILEVAAAADKKVLMALDDSFYVASFFFAAGCTLNINDSGKGVLDFNNANGLKAAEAFKTITADPAYITGDNNVVTGGIGGTIAAAVTGTWNAEAISEKLGDNFGAARLPTVKIGGEDKNLYSFIGCKHVGINKLVKTEYALAAADIADYLTNSANQLQRFKDRHYGPSNLNTIESPEVQADKVLAAFAAQTEFGFNQNNVPGSYWDPAKAFGVALVNKDYSKDLQTMLDAMVEQIQS